MPKFQIDNVDHEARAKALHALNRDELEDEARKVGIDDPSAYANKAALLDAVLAAEAGEGEAEEGAGAAEPAPEPAQPVNQVSGRRITDPAWAALTDHQRDMGMRLAYERFVKEANPNPTRILGDALKFVQQAGRKGLI